MELVLEWIQNGEQQNSELTKQRNHKTAKNKMENNKTGNNKTATITKQRTLQNSEHNKTVIITK